MDHRSNHTSGDSYYSFLNSITTSNLIKMKRIEFLLLIINGVFLFLVVRSFFSIVYEGFLSFSYVVILDYNQWLSGIYEAYRLYWIIFFGECFVIFLRMRFRSLTRVPVYQSEHLSHEQIYGDQEFIVNVEHDDSGEEFIRGEVDRVQEEEKEGKSSAQESSDALILLKNHRLYYLFSILVMALVIGYLNYFPRKELLFSSFVLSESGEGRILKPAEYATFFMINVVWSFTIFNFLLFLVFFSLFQRKNIVRVLRERGYGKYRATKDDKDAPWYIPPPKPLEYMTLEEKWAYKKALLDAQRSYVLRKKHERLRQLIEEEKLKQKLGKEGWKRLKNESKSPKQKKKTVHTSQSKEKVPEKKDKKKKGKEKKSFTRSSSVYDFR